MSDSFPAVPEGKPYSEADVTSLMESLGLTREAAIGTFEHWISGNGQFWKGLGDQYPAVYEAHMKVRGFVKNEAGEYVAEEKTATEQSTT